MDTIRHSDDEALDWLFNQARRYPLLTAEQERSTDQRKWDAVESLQSLFLADGACRDYLRFFTSQIIDSPPDARSMAGAENYALLRRELADYLQGKSLHNELQAANSVLAGKRDRGRDEAAISALSLPAALVAGIAALLTGDKRAGGVATALGEWHDINGVAEGSLPVAQAAAKTELLALLKQYRGARTRLVNHNLRLVFSIAGKLQGRSVPFRDLAQEGVFGLIRAAEKFDYRRGYRFSTYAYNWVTQAIRRAMTDQEGIVRFPSQVAEAVGRVHRERMTHVQRTGEEPTARWLAEQLDMDLADLDQLRQLGNLGISLASPRTDDDDGPDLEGTLEGTSANRAEAGAEQASLHRAIMQQLRSLTPVESNVVTLRWGLEQARPLSRKEIALQLGVSQERIRQIEGGALEKLRGDPTLAATFEDYNGADA